ncbi:hypothetical protein D3C79_894300 [compost metagenome]
MFPLVIALRQWGERFLFEAGEARSALLEQATGQAIAPLQVRTEDGRVLRPEDCQRRLVRHG